ncbi:MAG: hypothetical protein Q8P15_01385 [Nanoarchaeota archaeon]|nr:hypothetical protein [Nanoarchaeota archaeon]
MARYESKRVLVDYFKKNLTKGYTEDSLKWALVSQGYSKIEVTQALEQANKELAAAAPIVKEKPKIKYVIMDEHDNPIRINFSLWRRIKSWFRN